jgi:hypothetical protein
MRDEMEMVWHDNEPAGIPSVMSWAVEEEGNDAFKCCVVRKDVGATIDAKG